MPIEANGLNTILWRGVSPRPGAGLGGAASTPGSSTAPTPGARSHRPSASSDPCYPVVEGEAIIEALALYNIHFCSAKKALLCKF
jgi:hypothetical protein